MLAKRKLSFISFLLFSATIVQAESDAHNHQDMLMQHTHSQAPIGVMGDHQHEKGQWMIAYRYMTMGMEGMRSGTDSVSADQVVSSVNSLGGEMMRMGNLPNGDPRIMTVPGLYRVSPTKMDMSMHMVSLMYGVSDAITAMLMFNYIDKEMTSRTYMGMSGTTVNGQFVGKTSGVGDTQLSALIRLSDKGKHHFHLNMGLSLPTGSITESGKVLPPFAGIMTPVGESVEIDRLGYNMQLGSGTVDFLPGITYTAEQDDLLWGGRHLLNFGFMTIEKTTV